MLRATEEIKQRLSIAEVIGEYVKLERAGNYLKARCPFHSEKTPSFHVSPDRGTYYCFGCGAKGDVFDFVEQFEGLDFKGALKLLADRTGVSLSTYEVKDSTTELYAVLEKATEFFEKNLEENAVAQAYLTERHVFPETQKSFRIGVTKEGWSSLTDFLRKEGFSNEVIEKAGLAKLGERGLYDRFRNRVIFPIADSSGRIIGFSGRTLDPTELSKYINSPETPLYAKSKILYGFDKAKQAIKKKNYTIVVEGQFDLVLAHQAGFTNTVAVSGTAFTTEGGLESLSHLGILKRLSANILFAFDRDQAGENAAWKATRAAFALGMDVKILDLPTGKDPAEVIGEDKEQFKQNLLHANRAVVFFGEQIKKSAKDERALAKQVKEKVIPLIEAIPSAIDRSVAIREIAQITGFREDAISKDVRTSDQSSIKKTGEEPSPVPKLSLEDKIFGLIFYKENKGYPVEPLINQLKELLGEDLYLTARTQAEGFKEELLYLTDILYTLHDTSDTDIDLLLSTLAQELIKKRLKLLTDALSHTNKDDPAHQKLLEDFQLYTKKLQALTAKNHGN